MTKQLTVSLLRISSCLALALTCATQARASNRGTIRGRVVVVVNGERKSPGRDILVRAKGPKELKDVKTDSEGFFTYPQLMPGTWIITVRDDQLTKSTAKVTVIATKVATASPNPIETSKLAQRRNRIETPGDMIVLAAYRIQEPEPAAPRLPASQNSPDILAGVVQDEGGRPISGATVSCYSNAADLRASGEQELNLIDRNYTDGEGRYSIKLKRPHPPGGYILYVTHEEYEPLDETVAAGQAAPAALTLTRVKPEPGIPGSTEVELVEAARRNVFLPKMMEALPVPGTRSFDYFALLAPGVLPPPATFSTFGPGVSPGLGTAGDFSANGLRSRENNFSVDGSDNNDEDIGTRRQGFVVSSPQAIESIEEFQVISALADARFGRNIGGQVNALTKGGDRLTHGSLYGFGTTDRFNARDYFDARAADGPSSFALRRSTDGAPVLLDGQPLVTPNPSGGENNFERRLYGLTLGGPLWPGETFYFFSAEREQLDADREFHFSVPTLAERGAFGSGETGLSVNGGPAFAATLPGNAIFSLYPFPNNPLGPYGANNYTAVLPAGGRGVRFAGKIDHTVEGSGVPRQGPWLLSVISLPSYGDQITGRYNFTDERSTIPVTGGALFSALRPKVRTQNVAFFYNRTLSETMSDTIRFSFGRTRLFFGDSLDPRLTGSTFLPGTPFLLNAPLLLNVTTPGSQPNYVSAASPLGSAVLASLGLPGVTRTEEITGPLGQVSIAGFSPLGVDVYNFPQERANNTIQVADTFVYSRSAHLLNFGFDVRKTHINSTLDRNFRPFAEFHGLRGTDAVLPVARPGAGLISQDTLSPATLAAAGLPTGLFQTLATTPDSSIGLRYTQVNFFIHDEWRARPYLQFVYGLRYEINTIPDTVGRKIEGGFDPEELRRQIQQVAPECDLAGRCRDLTAALTSFFPNDFRVSFGTDRNDFDVRLGFVYDPGETGRFAIRGGFGSYSGQFPGIVLSQSRHVFPNYLPLNYAALAPRDGNRSFLFNLANPNVRALTPSLALIAPGTLNTIPAANPVAVLVNRLFNTGPVPPATPVLTPVLPQRRLSTPLAMHYGLTVEGELPRNYLMSVAYVGTRGLRLLRLTTPDLGAALAQVGFKTAFPLHPAAPFPFFEGSAAPAQADLISQAFSVSRSIFESSAASSYHSLQGELRKRYSHNFQFGISFTYSRTMDDASDFLDTAGAFALPQNSLRRSERGPASFDTRLRLVSHFVVDIPRDFLFLNFRRSLGGWQLAGVITNQTGQPYTVNSAFDVNADGNLTDRLETTAGLVEVSGDRRVKLRLAPGVRPGDLLDPQGGDGNVGRNTFRTNGIGNVDLSLTRKFTFREGPQLLVRAEIFNLFNRPHFAVPERILESSAFGASTRTILPARNLQFVLKLLF